MHLKALLILLFTFISSLAFASADADCEIQEDICRTVCNAHYRATTIVGYILFTCTTKAFIDCGPLITISITGLDAFSLR